MKLTDMAMKWFREAQQHSNDIDSASQNENDDDDILFSSNTLRTEPISPTKNSTNTDRQPLLL
jgi:hypothetical protein